MPATKFNKPVVRRCNGDVITAHWYDFMTYILMHPRCTRYECQRNVPHFGAWDQWETNTWAEMVRRGYINKIRFGVTFRYEITPAGLTVLTAAARKI